MGYQEYLGLMAANFGITSSASLYPWHTAGVMPLYLWIYDELSPSQER